MNFGWLDNPDAVKVVTESLPYPVISDVIKGVTEAPPATVYYWKCVERLFGKPMNEWDQNPVGSCVGFGTNKAAVVRQAVEIVVNGDNEEFVEYAPEITYGGSRVEIGKGGIGGDGSVGAWAAEFINKYGFVARGKYGEYDLTSYDPDMCRWYGRNGVPDIIEQICKQHPAKTVSQVKSWSDAKIVLAKGGTIAICSNRGFQMKRDSYGRCAPSGSWAHCMALIGYHTETNLELGFIDNSWGPTAHTGPLGAGTPPTSGFYADANVIDRDMLSSGDCWAIYDIEGIKKPNVKIDYLW